MTVMMMMMTTMMMMILAELYRPHDASPPGQGCVSPQGSGSHRESGGFLTQQTCLCESPVETLR